MSQVGDEEIDQQLDPSRADRLFNKTNSLRVMERHRILRNVVLVRLEPNIDTRDTEYQYLQTQLSNILDTIEMCTDPDQCINLCSDFKDARVLVIVPDTFAQQLIPHLCNMLQVHSIYILCRKESFSEQVTETKPKVKGFFHTIEDTYKMIYQQTRQCEHDSVPISIVPSGAFSNQSLNELEPLFMYSRLVKEILFGMDRDLHTKERFVKYLRERYQTNPANLLIIDEFEQNYRPASAVWWYTRGCFLFQMLNRALRVMDSDIIIKMSFFLYDLHQQLEQLHSSQSVTSIPGVVYRGQGMTRNDFDKLRRDIGGLISFNAFTSTSTDKQASYFFCPIPPQDPDTVPILFEMTIEPSLQSATFALLNNVSYYSDNENEVLFSMHTVFRIENVESIDDVFRQVKLTLTNDEDPVLKRLGERIKEETLGSTGWSRLGQLLIQMCHFNEAKEVYLTLMESLSCDDYEGLGNCYHQLGVVSSGKADYIEALHWYQKAIEFYKQESPENHIAIASVYNNIGAIYYKTGEFAKALEFYDKTSNIFHNILSWNDPALGTLYNNIGSVCESLQMNTEALEFHQKSLHIRQEILPPFHPSLAKTHRNIAAVYERLGEFSRALEFYEKALQIQEKSLPPKHHDLATTYNNIATVYDNMGNYTEALKYYEQDLHIALEIFPNHHQTLAAVHQNMGAAYDRIGEYSKALCFLQKSLEIRQRSLPDDHPTMAPIYNNMGSVYDHIGESSKALEYYQKGLDIYQKILPLNHSDLAASLNNIGSLHDTMGDYPKALEYYLKALDTKRISLPLHHPSLSTTYSNIGAVYENMGDYSKALEFYEKSLDVYNQSFDKNHPNLAVIYSNMGHLYGKMGKYSEALNFYDKSLKIHRAMCSSNDTIELATLYNNIGLIYSNIDEHARALEYFEKSMEIKQKILPQNHASLATTYNNIGLAYEGMVEYSKALVFYQKDLEISRATLPANHPDIATTLGNIGSLYCEIDEHWKALDYYQKALAIAEKSLPSDHPDLQQHRENLEILKHYLQEV